MASGTLRVSTMAELRAARRLGFTPGKPGVDATARCREEFQALDGSEVFAAVLQVVAVTTRGEEVLFTWINGTTRVRVRPRGPWSMTLSREEV